MDLRQLQQAIEAYLNSNENEHPSPTEQSKIATFLHGEELEGICRLLVTERTVIESQKRLQRKLQQLFSLSLQLHPENKAHFETIAAKEPKVNYQNSQTLFESLIL